MPAATAAAACGFISPLAAAVSLQATTQNGVSQHHQPDGKALAILSGVTTAHVRVVV
jgi:hypothetical protein